MCVCFVRVNYLFSSILKPCFLLFHFDVITLEGMFHCTWLIVTSTLCDEDGRLWLVLFIGTEVVDSLFAASP